jgi:hypothetical protein
MYIPKLLIFLLAAAYRPALSAPVTRGHKGIKKAHIASKHVGISYQYNTNTKNRLF